MIIGIWQNRRLGIFCGSLVGSFYHFQNSFSAVPCSERTLRNIFLPFRMMEAEPSTHIGNFDVIFLIQYLLEVMEGCRTSSTFFNRITEVLLLCLENCLTGF